MPIKSVKFLPFKFVYGQRASIASADDAYRLVADAFGAPEELADWSFDGDAELPFMMKLAEDSPDLLLAAKNAVFQHFQSIRKYPKAHSSDSFLIKRAVASAIATRYASAARDRGKKMRVAVMAPWLANNSNNNMLRVLAGYLAGLLRQENVEDAVLVVTNENSYGAETAISGAKIDSRVNRGLHSQVMAEHGVSAEHILYAPPPMTGEGNMAWHQKFLADYQPTVVFVPNVEMTSLHIHGFGKSAATVYLQTSVRNRPPYDFDRYLYLGEKREIDNTHIHPGRWFYHSFGYPKFGAGPGVSREELGLTADHFLMITVGNRLETELTPGFASIIEQVAADRSDVALLVLGARDEAKLRKNLGPLAKTLGGRLIFKGFVNSISDYLAVADVYVNPRRTGGAVSMALSVYAGTPILTFANNDANTFIVGEMICDSDEEYASRLAYMSRNKSFLKAIERIQRLRFERGHTEDASVANLVEHFKAALDIRGRA